MIYWLDPRKTRRHKHNPIIKNKEVNYLWFLNRLCFCRCRWLITELGLNICPRVANWLMRARLPVFVFPLASLDIKALSEPLLRMSFFIPTAKWACDSDKWLMASLMSMLFAWQRAVGHYLSNYYSFVLRNAQSHKPRPSITWPCAPRCSPITQRDTAN